jgi:hypothetical protein
MLLDDLIVDHKAQLGRAVERFRAEYDADFIRHFALAARRLDGKRPRQRMSMLAVTVGEVDYPAAAGSLAILAHEWGIGSVRQPWDSDFMGIPPLIRQLDSDDGLRWRLSAAPTANQITAWGPTIPVRYQAAHEIGEDRVTPPDSDRSLVLLAALIEAMRDLSTETAVVQLHKGLTGLPTAGTPAYLYERLLQEFVSA